MVHRRTEEERERFGVRKGGQVWRMSDGSQSEGAEEEKIGDVGRREREKREGGDGRMIWLGRWREEWQYWRVRLSWMIYEGEENVNAEQTGRRRRRWDWRTRKKGRGKEFVRRTSQAIHPAPAAWHSTGTATSVAQSWEARWRVCVYVCVFVRVCVCLFMCV